MSNEIARGCADAKALFGPGRRRARAAEGPLEVRCLGSLEEVRPLRAELDAINLRSRQKDPFSTFAYYETYLGHDELRPRGPMELWFLIAFRGARPVAYLPLRRVRQEVIGGLCSWTVEFMVTHDTDRPHVVAAPEDEVPATRALLDYVLRRRRDWSSLQLQQQPEDSTLWPLPPEFGRRRLLTRRFPNPENCTLPIRWTSLEQYHRELSKSRRTEIGRHVRRLLGAGAVRYLSSSDPGCTPLLLELYASIEPRSWKSRAGGTITRHERRVAHFRDLLRPDQPMRIRLDVLMLDGVPIAGMMGGEFARRMVGLQVAYDSAHAKLSPGTLLALLEIDLAIQTRMEALNLLSGFSYYKSRWLAEIQPTHAVQAFRPLTLPWVRAQLGALQRRLGSAGTGSGDFNPERRAVEPELGEAAATTDDERAGWAALVDRLDAGRARLLDNALLAARLPFVVGKGGDAAPAGEPGALPALRKSRSPRSGVAVS